MEKSCLWSQAFPFGVLFVAFFCACGGPAAVNSTTSEVSEQDADTKQLGATNAPIRIAGYGDVSPVASRELLPSTSQAFKVAFDISKAPKSPSEVNPALDKLARYINLLAEAGIDSQGAKFIAVIHGDPTFSVLNNSDYRKRFNVDNPNLPLLRELKAVGFELKVCGQALASRNIEPDQVDQQVDVVLSALTALTALAQQQFYIERLG